MTGAIWLDWAPRLLLALVFWCSFLALLYALACRLGRHEGLAHRLALIFLLGPSFLFLVGSALIAIAGFRVWALALLCLPQAAGAHFLWRRENIASLWRRDLARIPSFGEGSPSFVTRFALLCLGALGLRALFAPPLAWDTVTYHATKAAFWVQEGGRIAFDTPGGWNFQRRFPEAMEILLAWWMLPWRSDFLCGALDVSLYIGLACVATALLRSEGLTRGASQVCTCFFLLLPTSILLFGSHYSEPLLLLSAMLALYFGGRSLRGAGEVDLLYASAALGLHANTKLNAWPWAMLMLLLLVGTSFARRLRRREAFGLRSLLWPSAAVGIFSLHVAPWLLQGWFEGRLPFSPLPLKIAGISLGRPGPALDWYVERPLSAPGWRFELTVLRGIFSPIGSGNESLGILCGLALLPLFFCLPLFLWRRRLSSLPWLFVLLTSASFYVHPHTQVLKELWTASTCRFLLLGVFAALAINALALQAWPRVQALYTGMLGAFTLFHGLRFAMPFWSVHDMRRVCIAAGVSLVAFLLLRSPSTGRRRVVLRSLALASMLVLLGWMQQEWQNKRYETLATGKTLDFILNYWASSAAMLDHLALTAGPAQNADNWFAYYFFGRRFQNRLSYISSSASGDIVHFEAKHRYLSQVDREAWLRRLDAKGIDHVFSFAPHSIEIEWMEAMPQRFYRRQGDGFEWGLYEVRPPL